MKVLLVNDYGTPTAGAEVLTLALRDALRERGDDARLLASSARPMGAESLADYTFLGTMSRFRTALQSCNVWGVRRFRQVMREFQPDIVHVNVCLTQLSPLFLPLLRDVPSVYHAHWYRSICPIGTKTLPDGRTCGVDPGIVCYRHGCLPMRDWAPLMVQMRLWRKWHGVFDRVVAVSDAVKRRLTATGIADVDVIWNGVPVRTRLPTFAVTPTVGFAGRLVPEKGADVLVRAFAKVVKCLPQARLDIIGDGPQRGFLQTLVHDLGLSSSVRMLGHLQHAEVARQLDDNWVQVVPSVWEDPFPTIALESTMKGIAVVGSEIGGLPEIIRHGETGLIVPPGDENALAQALEALLIDRDKAQKMGQAGHEFAVRNFNADTFVRKFRQLYETLCS